MEGKNLGGPQGGKTFQPDEFLSWLEKALSGKNVTCTSADFDPRGRIVLNFTSPSVGKATLWLGQEGSGVRESLLGSLGYGEGAHHQGALVLLHFAANRLDAIGRHYQVPFLQLLKSKRFFEPITFTSRLFEGFIGPYLQAGQTRIGGYVFSGCRENEDGSLTYKFENAYEEIEILVSLDPSEGTVYATRNLYFSLPPNQSDSAPFKYVAFLLACCDQEGVTYRRRPSGPSSLLSPTFIEWGGRMEMQFFLEEPGHDILNLFYVLYASSGPIAILYHSERECANCACYFTTPYRYWASTHLHLPPGPNLAGRVFLTDMDEASSWSGGEELLKEAIKYVSSKPEVELLLVAESCLPRVIGDDVHGCARASSEPQRLVIGDITKQEVIEPFRDLRRLWHDIVAPRIDRSYPVDEDAVNLVGFGVPGTSVVDDLTRSLSVFGVRVAGCLMPGIDWEHLRRFDAVKAHIVHPWYYVTEVFGDIAQASTRPSYYPQAPYGWRGTARWLKEVASIVKGDIQGAENISEELRNLWDALVARVASTGFEVAFVVASTQRETFLDERRTFGVRLPEFVAETGFRIALLCYDPLEARHSPLRVEPEDLWKEVATIAGTDVRLEVFDRPEALQSLLSHPDIRLVYSEIPFDGRVAASGKEQFSPQDLEMGFRGALRTVRRLALKAFSTFRQNHRLFLTFR